DKANSTISAEVEVSELMGSEIYLYLDYKGNKLTARVSPRSLSKPGKIIKIAFNPNKVHLFDPASELTIMN
ncbi:MAG: TOBE domain-containing protein, partial [Oscillospiraceae bacterium]